MKELSDDVHCTSQTALNSLTITAPLSPNVAAKKHYSLSFSVFVSILVVTILCTHVVESFVQQQHQPQWISQRRNQTGCGKSPSILSMTASTVDARRPSDMSDFQRRMRNLVTETDDKQRSKQKLKRRRPSNFQIIDTLEEYKKTVGGNKDKLIVVRFFAPWCKACKAIAPSYHRLALTFPHVTFVDVPATPTNANLHQGLGVPSLPYGHIYHPSGGLVEELKMSKKFFPYFADTLQTYIDGQCDIGDIDIPFE